MITIHKKALTTNPWKSFKASDYGFMLVGGLLMLSLGSTLNTTFFATSDKVEAQPAALVVSEPKRFNHQFSIKVYHPETLALSARP